MALLRLPYFLEKTFLMLSNRSISFDDRSVLLDIFESIFEWALASVEILPCNTVFANLTFLAFE